MLLFLWSLVGNGTRRERPAHWAGKKVSGGHFFSSGESPLRFRTHPYGCGRKRRISQEQITDSKGRGRVPRRKAHPVPNHPKGQCSFYGMDGPGRERPAIGRAKKCPVDTFLARGRVPCASERTRMGVGGSAESGRSWVMGLERPAAAFAAVKTVRWTVFRPWESPAPQGASSSKPPQRTVFLLWDGWAWSRAGPPLGGQKSVRWTLF